MIKTIIAIDKRSMFLCSSDLLVLGQIGPDGVAAPSGCGLSVLDGLLGTFVDAAQTLIALGRPYRFPVLEGNGGRRTVPGTLVASVAAVLGKERFCASGKFVEPKVDEMGLQSSQCPLVNPVYPYLPPELLDDPVKLFTGCDDFLENLALIIGIRADDVVVWHQQAITAVQMVQFGKLLHGQSGISAAGADTEGEDLGLWELLHKVHHDLRYAPGIDRKEKAELFDLLHIRQLVQVGNIIGFVAGEGGQMTGRPRRVACSRKIENHLLRSLPLPVMAVCFKYKGQMALSYRQYPDLSMIAIRRILVGVRA